jgi:hypothetical protein
MNGLFIGILDMDYQTPAKGKHNKSETRGYMCEKLRLEASG